MASSDRPRRRRPAELPLGTDIFEFLLSLPPDDRAAAVAALGFTEADALDRDWPSWAHDGQLPPASGRDGVPWSTCVVMGGRGFGKTRAGAEWIVSLLKGPDGRSPRKPLRIALVGATLAEARRVMVEGRSGLLAVAGPWIRRWQPSLGLLAFRTGAEAQLFSGASPEMLRGPEHDYAWCDELAKWEKPQESWDMLRLGLRLGANPQALVTTTPRPGPVLRAIMASPGCVVVGGPSHANPHASPAWLARMDAQFAGTRLGRQELGGELLPDTPGALWTPDLLDRCRQNSLSPPGERAGERGSPNAHPHALDVLPDSPSPNLSPEGRGAFARLVVAIDPPSGDGTCGIIACARDREGRGHVLADHSVTALSPEGWARAAVTAARLWERLHPQVPLALVAEANQGGKMVAAVLRTADPGLRVKPVTATAGKADRAAPVAMLFEAGKIVLHGRFPELEAELCGLIAGGAYEGPGASPDRADAMVWALTELMLAPARAEPGIRAF